MIDREKLIKAWECHQIQENGNAYNCVGCPYIWTDDCTEQMAKETVELLKEQEHLLTEYEKLSKVLFKIDKYFKISDLSRLVDGIENGKIIVLQDNGHFIGGTPFTETTIKIRRL